MKIASGISTGKSIGVLAGWVRLACRHPEEILGGVMLFSMCAIAVLQVAGRYLLREPFSWTEEVCTFLFVWLVFVGASLALRTRDHFAVLILVEKMPLRIQRTLVLFGHALVLLFAALLIYYGARMAIAGWSSVTPALEVPRTLPYAALPAGGILILIRALQNLARDLQRPALGEDSEVEENA